LNKAELNQQGEFPKKFSLMVKVYAWHSLCPIAGKNMAYELAIMLFKQACIIAHKIPIYA
jgi:hypothetical protein